MDLFLAQAIDSSQLFRKPVCRASGVVSDSLAALPKRGGMPCPVFAAMALELLGQTGSDNAASFCDPPLQFRGARYELDMHLSRVPRLTERFGLRFYESVPYTGVQPYR
jgi:hypothetical protein